VHRWIKRGVIAGLAGVWSVAGQVAPSAQSVAAQPAGARLIDAGPDRTISEADCVATKVGESIPATRIGEPVRSVTLAPPRWVTTNAGLPARCEVDGIIAPVDTSASARPINFRVWLPSTWNHRAVQLGGGGMNGVLPDLRGGGFTLGGSTPAQAGFVTYGSDSGHQLAPPGAGAGRGPATAGPPVAGSQDWALNDEAIANLGYMQLKKTHDAAMTLVERVYGERPRYSYFAGTSQGGREALTVAQRYPADYDGVVANVPIVGFSSLMLAPELIRIQEIPAANWVPPAKVNAIRGEFMRQCDGLDGHVDGVMNNYMACRAIFDVSEGKRGRHPWIAKRCPNGIDPDPADTTAAACLTDGQMSTLEFIYRPYAFATPLANGSRSFGMWVPNTDPSGSGLLVPTRFRGQEGAAADAPMHAHLGVLGVTGFLMRDPTTNPLGYREGGALNGRRQELSRMLDSTNPDLRAFASRGGKMIVTIGTNDTLASPGAQLDYYQSVLDTMGRGAVDSFARLFVIPQVGHGLTGTVYATDGAGAAVPPAPVASGYERFAYLVDWVERKQAPAASLVVTTGDRSMPLCGYPRYPKYMAGPPSAASSYACADR